jgi:hypothetical protein
MIHTQLARQYEAELVALREGGYPADLDWGEGDAAVIRVERPGGHILVTDAVLGTRLADRGTEPDGGWKVLAFGDFNETGTVVAEGDTVVTEDADAPTLVAAVDLLSRTFFPVLDVEL